MLAIPAIDLREGCVVQLVGGDFDKEKIRLGDPRDIARRWTGYGFQRLHVVDLDAATGRGSNRSIVRDLLADAATPVQVGGGIRTTDEIESLLSDGADRIVVGTRAIDDPDWLREIADANPGAIVLAADVRDRRIVTHGWTREHAAQHSRSHRRSRAAFRSADSSSPPCIAKDRWRAPICR